VKGLGFGRERAPTPRTVTCQAGSITADRVPDMEKRKLMNLLLLGAISLPTVGMVVPYGSFFVPGGSVPSPQLTSPIPAAAAHRENRCCFFFD
jgi:cytochrome b6-f complex iron-sulfur subunit